MQIKIFITIQILNVLSNEYQLSVAKSTVDTATNNIPPYFRPWLPLTEVRYNLSLLNIAFSGVTTITAAI